MVFVPEPAADAGGIGQEETAPHAFSPFISIYGGFLVDARLIRVGLFFPPSGWCLLFLLVVLSFFFACSILALSRPERTWAGRGSPIGCERQRRWHHQRPTRRRCALQSTFPAYKRETSCRRYAGAAVGVEASQRAWPFLRPRARLFFSLGRVASSFFFSSSFGGGTAVRARATLSCVAHPQSPTGQDKDVPPLATQSDDPPR